MAAIQDFILKIKTEGQEKIKQVSDQVRNLGDSFNNANQSFDNINGKISNVIKGFGLLGTAIGAAGGAFATLVTKGIALGDELGDLSDATNISAGSLLTLRNSIIEAGGKADDFAKISSKLNQSVQQAAGGNEELQKAFKTLGVFVTDSGGQIRKTEAILNDLTDRFRQGRLTGEEYASAMKLLGESINRLDLTKLDSAGNAITDEQVNNITRFTGEIDKLKEAFNTLALEIGGNVAESINNVIDRIKNVQQERKNIEREFNLQGMTGAPAGDFQSRNRFDNPVLRAEIKRREGSVGPLIGSILPTARRMSPEEQAIFNEEMRLERMAEATSAYRPTRRFGAPGIDDDAMAGGFGRKSEAQLKAEAALEMRIQQILNQDLTNEFLRSQEMRLSIVRETGSKMQVLEAQMQADINTEIRRAEDLKRSERMRIMSQDRLTEEQKLSEFAQKELEIESNLRLKSAQIANRYSEEVIKFRADAQRAQFLANEEEREQNRRDLAEFENSRANAIKSIDAQVGAIRSAREESQQRFAVEQQIAGLSDREQTFRRKILDLEFERQRAIENVGNIAELTAEDRLEAERRINDEYQKTLDNLATQEGLMRRMSRSFSDGWEKAFERYAESAENNSEYAASLFQTATRGMEDAIVNFAQTGKLSFRDMANAIIADIIRMQVRRSIVSFMMAPSLFPAGGPTAGPALLGMPGAANGGFLTPNRAYLVGERGPEVFLPKSPGTVVPNHQLSSMNNGGSMVTYNINAVDAASFRSLVARDPSFIHAVAERGRNSQPSRRS